MWLGGCMAGLSFAVQRVFLNAFDFDSISLLLWNVRIEETTNFGVDDAIWTQHESGASVDNCIHNVASLTLLRSNSTTFILYKSQFMLRINWNGMQTMWSAMVSSREIFASQKLMKIYVNSNLLFTTMFQINHGHLSLTPVAVSLYFITTM